MKDEEIMRILRNENEEYKKLEEEHRRLDQSLDEMLKKKYLTPEEEVEKKKIQKQKLQYKDRMAQIIRDYNQGVRS
ncbi:MAG TPA: DUF465 domain-containing protein [Nitrospiraceae bacterium]|jgi:uncharacterized protein YdcH (DUF465 family)|nr:DUF465 domain-containing protein [Nitrospiraceae bacterium]